MPWKAISPLKIYGLLPRTNCRRCEMENCMAFAVRLANMEVEIDMCPPMLEEEKYRKSYLELTNTLHPPVKQVEFGSTDRKVIVGGEYVMHRHELTYKNPTVFALDIDDEMDDKEVTRRLKFVEDFSYIYIGTEMKLDALAIRSVSNDRQKFKNVVKFVREKTNLPLILCSLNSKIIETGLSVLERDKPLIYAVTKENWKEMSELSRKRGCPMAVSSPNDMNTLVSLTQTLQGNGVNDLVLDPGTFPGNGLSKTIDALTMLRWKACNDRDKLLGYPLMGTPITTWMGDEDDQTKCWRESITTAALIDRYTDLLILHGTEGWGLLPNIILRFNIYTDPKKPVSVKPGLKAIGNPDEKSPVMVTSNFALTYYIVSGDIESGKINCHLIVADSEGMALEAAVAGREFSAKEVADAIKESGIEGMIKHRNIIIPGLAARLSGEIEEATGWKVIVGPRDSSGIPKFIQEKWKNK